jgi:hypothetical protein
LIFDQSLEIQICIAEAIIIMYLEYSFQLQEVQTMKFFVFPQVITFEGVVNGQIAE